MIPKLFEATAAQFDTMGIGGLGKASQCKVRRQLNGAYELEMIYPLTGPRFRELVNRRIIYAGVGPGEDAQPFRIYKTRYDLLMRKHVWARHLAYDLMGFTLEPFQADSLEGALNAIAGSAMVQPRPFNITADFARDTGCQIPAPRSVWAMLGGQRGSLLDVYGGEYEFDRFSVVLRNRVGADTDIIVRFTKNLKELTQESSLANTWTAVQPYWLSADESTLVTLPEGSVSAGEFDYTRVLVWDASLEFEEPPTAEELRNRTRQYISSNRVGDEEIGLDVTWVPLDQTEEYKHLPSPGSVHLGDTVAVEYPTVADPKTNAPTDFVRTSARVIETVWLPMEEKYESVRIGTKRSSFVSVVAQTQKTINWILSKIKR